MVTHGFDPSTQETESGGSLSEMPAWSTEKVPRPPVRKTDSSHPGGTVLRHEGDMESS